MLKNDFGDYFVRFYQDCWVQTQIMNSLCFDDTKELKERVKQLVQEIPYVISAFNRSAR